MEWIFIAMLILLPWLQSGIRNRSKASFIVLPVLFFLAVYETFYNFFIIFNFNMEALGIATICSVILLVIYYMHYLFIKNKLHHKENLKQLLENSYLPICLLVILLIFMFGQTINNAASSDASYYINMTKDFHGGIHSNISIKDLYGNDRNEYMLMGLNSFLSFFNETTWSAFYNIVTPMIIFSLSFYTINDYINTKSKNKIKTMFTTLIVFFTILISILLISMNQGMANYYGINMALACVFVLLFLYSVQTKDKENLKWVYCVIIGSYFFNATAVVLAPVMGVIALIYILFRKYTWSNLWIVITCLSFSFAALGMAYNFEIIYYIGLSFVLVFLAVASLKLLNFKWLTKIDDQISRVSNLDIWYKKIIIYIFGFITIFMSVYNFVYGCIGIADTGRTIEILYLVINVIILGVMLCYFKYLLNTKTTLSNFDEIFILQVIITSLLYFIIYHANTSTWRIGYMLPFVNSNYDGLAKMGFDTYQFFEIIPVTIAIVFEISNFNFFKNVKLPSINNSVKLVGGMGLITIIFTPLITAPLNYTSVKVNVYRGLDQNDFDMVDKYDFKSQMVWSDLPIFDYNTSKCKTPSNYSQYTTKHNGDTSYSAIKEFTEKGYDKYFKYYVVYKNSHLNKRLEINTINYNVVDESDNMKIYKYQGKIPLSKDYPFSYYQNNYETQINPKKNHVI